MKSIAAMIEQIEGLLGTDDLTAWEQDFVTNISKRYRNPGNGGRTDYFGERVVTVIERIWSKHFAG